MSDALRARCDLDALERLAAADRVSDPECEECEGSGSVKDWSGSIDCACLFRHQEALSAAVPELVRRLREAEGIVRDLAAGTPDGPASTNCVLCLQFYSYGQTDHHLPTCPYRRAVDATRRED